MGANPWEGIAEANQASTQHMGAIIGESLSNSAVLLIAEATTRAAKNNLPSAEAIPAELAVNGGDGKREMVDAFILRCKKGLSVRVSRKSIWRAVGHTTARQFQFWQASHRKATAQDDQNFQRILAMNPTEFEAVLKKRASSDLQNHFPRFLAFPRLVPR